MNAAHNDTRSLVCQMQLLAEELQGAGPGRVVMHWRQKTVSLPDERAQVSLNPMERTLYRLFLAHPEGISADNLLLHWQELQDIYARESCYDDPDIREAKLESLCGESKRVFYSTVSRVKKKLTEKLGPWRAGTYIIKNEGGVYKVQAKLTESEKRHSSCPPFQ